MENDLIFPKEWSDIRSGMIGGYSVTENPLLEKRKALILKESNQIVCGDIYLFCFKSFDIETASDLCFGIAQQRISNLINNFK